MDAVPVSILLVEDNPGDAHLLRFALEEAASMRFSLVHAATLTDGVRVLHEKRMDVVLLDLSLPDSTGLETLIDLREEVPDVPIIVLTGNLDEEMSVKAVQAGAQDYLVKGRVDGSLLTRAIRYAIERHRLQEAIHNLSLTDELTGLYNRRGFMTFGEQHRKVAVRSARGFLVVFVDVDGLKRINDTYGLGHGAGDDALIGTADVLRRTFRDSDIIARMGGDEFAIIAFESDNTNAAVIEKRVEDTVARYNAERQRPFTLSLSVGVVHYRPISSIRLEDLLAEADSRMYTAKRRKYARGLPNVVGASAG